jgi:two-component system LytT family response regulator
MSTRLRTLIVEDEPHARALLCSMLAARDDVEVVGEAADGRAAVEAIAEHQPDLLFLDVQMPELDGFRVLQEACVERSPVVVFVTAFDRYALRAFDVHAVDYLLKPFDAERVDRAVTRAAAQLETVGAAEVHRRLAELLAHVRGPDRKPLERIPLKVDGRVRFVNVADVDWIEADDHMLRLHVGKEVHVIRESLGNIEARLDPGEFVRLHRAIIVNVRRILEVQPWFQGDYVVVLADGTKLTTGRTYRDNLRRLIDFRDDV